MIVINEELGLSIDISDELLDDIRHAGLLHYPNEFGGVLIGQYSNDKQSVKITEMILPLAYTSTRYTFNRGVEGLKERLLEFFTANPSKIYVGEWHTHPNAQPFPSGTDIRALKEIVAAESVTIDNPVMLIVGLTQTKVELGFYVYLKNKIYRYEMV